MAAETMTSRERWLAVLQGEKPDRIPTDYWATPEATEKLLAYLELPNLDEAFKRLHVDRPLSVGGRYVGPELRPGESHFGIRSRKVDYGTGSYNEVNNAPLAEYETASEIEADYRWPDPDWWAYDHIPDEVAQYPDRPIQGGGSEPLLTYKSLRGEEQAFMDLILKPDIVHYCLDKLFDLCYKATERIYDQIPGQVMISYVAEDLGSQESLLYSPGQIREFLLPRMKRMMDLVHDAGAYVFHHSDGAMRDILPDMVELGIDVLNPIQWRCQGMEREGLKSDFGDKLVFHGAMDNQYTLPFGTIEEVRQEVMDNIAILGRGGGYILAPCHNIQSVGPPENVVAMYDAVYELTSS